MKTTYVFLCSFILHTRWITIHWSNSPKVSENKKWCGKMYDNLLSLFLFISIHVRISLPNNFTKLGRYSFIDACRGTTTKLVEKPHYSKIYRDIDKIIGIENEFYSILIVFSVNLIVLNPLHFLQNLGFTTESLSPIRTYIHGSDSFRIGFFWL